MQEKKVLFVDDEAELRRLFVRILRREGYEVDVAEDGWEAVQLSRLFGYPVVIMDLRMPRMSGQEAIDRIERFSPQTRFVIISGYSLDSQIRTRVDRGEMAYFLKPFDNDKVVRKVNELYCLGKKFFDSIGRPL